MTNRHPVDELADVQTAIGHLKIRETELRNQILNGECSTVGDLHEAFISEFDRESLDAKLIRRELGTKTLQPYLRTTHVRFVRVVPKSEEN